MENEVDCPPMHDVARKANENAEDVWPAGGKSLVVKSQNRTFAFPRNDNEELLSRSRKVPLSPSEAPAGEDNENYYVVNDGAKSAARRNSRERGAEKRKLDLARNSEETDSNEFSHTSTQKRIDKNSKCTCSTDVAPDISEIEEMSQFVESIPSSTKRGRQGQSDRKPRMVVKPNQDRILCHPHEKSQSLQVKDVWQTADAASSSRVSETMGQLLASARCSFKAEVSGRESVSSMDTSSGSAVCCHETSGTPATVRRQVAKVLHLPVTSAAAAPVTCAGLLLRAGADRCAAHARTDSSDIYATIKAPNFKAGGEGARLTSAEEMFLKPSSTCCQATTDRRTTNALHVYYTPRSTTEDLFVRIILSATSALAVAGIAFLWTHFYLRYAFTTSAGLSAVLCLALVLSLSLSRVCRCVSSLVLPSVSTPRGRVALIIVTSALLLTEPCENIYSNVQEAARAIGCSVERGYNQTLMLIEPFDALMGHVNQTIAGLQDSARGVVTGLRPLDEGLADIESDLDNGRLQLFGTEKTCRNLIERSFNSCASGILQARSQCLSVIGALGSVYHHARGILDTINPDRWAPKQQQQLLLQKRQTLHDRRMKDLNLPEDDANICEPLNVQLVCQSLNDSDTLCQPSKWAGDAIQEAINATQAALHDLDDALHFSLTSEPYHSSRKNSSAVVFRIRQKVLEEFLSCTAHFRVIVGILTKLAISVSLLLVLRESYIYLQLFLTSTDFDNIYIAEEFRALDRKLPETALGSRSILPLRKYELKYMVDTSSWKLGHMEEGLHWKGMAVFLLFLLVSLSCCGFDLVLYWVLTLAQKHGSQGVVEESGADGLRLVVSGNGIIVEFLDQFLKGFEPDRWLSQSSDASICLPSARTPSIPSAVLILVFHLVLLLSVLLKAYSFRARSKISGHFYPDRRKERAAYLYRMLQCRRPQLPRLLRQVARTNRRVRERLRRDSLFGWFLIHAPCRAWLRSGLQLRRSCACLVCECVLEGSDGRGYQECVFQRCGETYCVDCFEDLGRICPVCLPPATEVGLENSASGCLWDLCQREPLSEPDRYDHPSLDSDGMQSSKVFCRPIYTD